MCYRLCVCHPEECGTPDARIIFGGSSIRSVILRSRCRRRHEDRRKRQSGGGVRGKTVDSRAPSRPARNDRLIDNGFRHPEEGGTPDARIIFGRSSIRSVILRSSCRRRREDRRKRQSGGGVRGKTVESRTPSRLAQNDRLIDNRSRHPEEGGTPDARIIFGGSSIRSVILRSRCRRRRENRRKRQSGGGGRGKAVDSRAPSRPARNDILTSTSPPLAAPRKDILFRPTPRAFGMTEEGIDLRSQWQRRERPREERRGETIARVATPSSAARRRGRRGSTAGAAAEAAGITRFHCTRRNAIFPTA